jgi:hypothetical protein
VRVALGTIHTNMPRNCTVFIMRCKRPSHTAAITKTITITTQRERILLVELLHAEYAHAHSTNGMRFLCIVIVIVIAAVGPSLRPLCLSRCTFSHEKVVISEK